MEKEAIAYIVQFVVEATSVANRFPVRVSPPQGCRRGCAVCARGALSLRGRLEKKDLLSGMSFCSAFPS